MRLFVADDTGSRELTDGDRKQPIARVSAPDLQQAQRMRQRIHARSDGAAAILDIVVAIAADFRTARRALGPVGANTVHYAGTVAGLLGLISDIASAGVADGVTLIAGSPTQDVTALGREVLGRLHEHRPAHAS